MIQFNNVSKSFGGQDLYDELSFTMGPGEKCGIVGKNGSGKSTLFKMITGDLPIDGGNISIPKKYKIGYLEQHLKFSKETILDECALALPADKRDALYLVEKILMGLGFSLEDLKKAPADFSGGFQLRLNLAKVLIQAPNLLLLDEPTNYLDIVGLRWLRNFLKDYPGEILLITHDRHFMDGVVDHIMGIRRRKIKKIKGSTQKYFEQLNQEDEIYDKTRVNLDKKRKQMTVFIDKFKAKASKATQAQSKMKMLEKMGTMEELEVERDMNLNFSYSQCPSKNLFSADGLSFHYKNGPMLLSDFTLHVNRNDKIAIIGKNGKGKSTLLKLLAGELKPISGDIKCHPDLKMGYFGQTNKIRLSDECTVAEEVASANPELPTSVVRSICGSFMFEGDFAKKKIKVLSGGERARVLLGQIVAQKSNILLLDEPTNHLDQESVEILLSAIENYPGAAIIVTHNEMILERLAKKMVVFNNNKVEVFNGGYDDFLRKIGWEEEGPTQIVQKKGGKKENKKKRAEIIQERSKICKPLKKEIELLEQSICTCEEILKENQDFLSAADYNQDKDKIIQINQEIKELEKSIEENFEKLEQKSALLEKLEQEFSQRLDEL